MRKSTTLAALAASSIAACAAADLVSIQSNSSLSTESLGSYTGSLAWDFLGGSSGQLTVSLTNTSSLANGGYLTAFLFRAPLDTGLSADLLSSTDLDFLEIASGESASPFAGTWSGGAGLGSSFLGGGSPVPGLAVGQSATFVFSITSSQAGSLSAASFLSGAYDFVVRFRGFENGGSDKVPGQLVPGAASVAALALGLARRRRART